MLRSRHVICGGTGGARTNSQPDTSQQLQLGHQPSMSMKRTTTGR